MPTIIGHHNITKGAEHWLSSPKRKELETSKNHWARRRSGDSLEHVASGARAWSIGRQVSLILMSGSRS